MSGGNIQCEQLLERREGGFVRTLASLTRFLRDSAGNFRRRRGKFLRFLPDEVRDSERYRAFRPQHVRITWALPHQPNARVFPEATAAGRTILKPFVLHSFLFEVLFLQKSKFELRYAQQRTHILALFFSSHSDSDCGFLPSTLYRQQEISPNIRIRRRPRNVVAGRCP